MTVLMPPDMANFSGNVHGGTLTTDEQLRRVEQAVMRRQLRRELQARFDADGAARQ